MAMKRLTDFASKAYLQSQIESSEQTLFQVFLPFSKSDRSFAESFFLFFCQAFERSLNSGSSHEVAAVCDALKLVALTLGETCGDEMLRRFVLPLNRAISQRQSHVDRAAVRLCT